MFNKLKATMGFMMIILGYGAEKEFPVDAESKSLKFKEDEIAKLKAHFGDNYETLMSTVNGEIKAYLENSTDMKAIQDEIDALVKEKDLNAKAIDDNSGEKPNAADTSEKLNLLANAHSEEKALRVKLQAQVDKLMNEGVGDQPEAIINNAQNMKVVHSATHLFADNKDWNKLEARAWNQRLKNNDVKATDFNTDGTIPLLQDDLAHFVRENPNALNSLFNDTLELPSEWDRRSGVLDRVADGFIIPAEIVQGRKKGWSPKNEVKIVAEEGRVFRKKIDITFDGYELQQIENTWIRSYNGSDGSHPWKMTFVFFLLSELVKQQMLDDRKAQINGIFAESPEGDTPGAAVNSQDGLRFLFWYHREVSQKFRPTYLGPITDANIVDKIDKLIKSLPETERFAEGLELGMSQANLDRYRTKAGLLYQMHKTTDSGTAIYDKSHPVDFPNIKFQPLRDMTDTDFMYITASKNIQILDYNTNEKGKFTVTHDKRETHIFADYRLGIRLKFVGTKLQAGDPSEFERQKVWTNEAPIFSNRSMVPLFDDETGIIQFHYKNMIVDKAWKTDITAIEKAPKYTIIKITGDTRLVSATKVVDGGSISLVSDFNLKSGGTLTLQVLADGTVKEIKRTTAPDVVPTTDVVFTGTAIDASAGTAFRYEGAADATLANIINGVEGKTIRIYGTDAANVEITIADVANVIDVPASRVLPDSVSYVQLTLIDGVWYEVGGFITV